MWFNNNNINNNNNNNNNNSARQLMPGFSSGVAHVGFVVNRVAVEKVSLPVLRVFPVSVIPPILTYLLTCLLTHSMQQSPSSEANSFSASQAIPRILWNPTFHYRSHKPPPPVPILSRPNSVHTPTSQFFTIHLNIILPSTPGSPQCFLFVRFPHKNPVHSFPSPICATCPAHLIILDSTPT
jgi:hypothetical protein